MSLGMRQSVPCGGDIDVRRDDLWRAVEHHIDAAFRH